MEWLTYQSTWTEVGSILLRLTLGVILAGAIGLERESNGRPAGIRTHMLVALGAMVFSEVGRAYGGDPSRVAAQVVTGVGFLGAGTIMRMGAEVKGLTTAASVWATAAIGMAVSAGGAFAIVAIVATILVLVTLAFIDELPKKVLADAGQIVLNVRTTSKACFPAIIDHLYSEGIDVRSSEIHPDEGEYEMVFELDRKKAQALNICSVIEDVRSARWSE